MKTSFALNEYLNSLNNHTTVVNYEIALKEFLKRTPTTEKISVKKVEKYKFSLREKSPQTRASRMSAIRGFCDYCWTQGWLDNDPSLCVKNDPTEKYAKAKNVTLEEYGTLLKAISTDAIKGLRDLLLLRLIYIIGDVNKVLLYTWGTKVPANLEIIKKYFAKSLLDNIDMKELKRGYVFFSLDSFDTSTHLSRSAVRKLLKKYTESAGFEENYFDFQALKRLRAKQIYEETGSVDAVNQFCGHKSMKATRALIKTFS
jgi:site-specific recombinase XerD